jgi:hypothetical protein
LHQLEFVVHGVDLGLDGEAAVLGENAVRQRALRDGQRPRGTIALDLDA